MLSILDQAPPEPAPSPEPAPARPEEKVSEAAQQETGEYEIVLGRAQIASWLFVAVIVIAACSSLAYLAGKSTTAKKVAAADVKPPEPAPATTPQAVPQTPPAPLPTASIVVQPKVAQPKADPQTPPATSKSAQPLFAEPVTGKVYIQMGAVERGMAIILAEGLRSHGFDAFVAPGPSDRIFRVLIGPLPDPESFRQAKAAVDAIELSTFARKYEK
ncbi:MAG: hypothetical protein EXQ47_07590 [Bryobacterales bacterium]|nr:hypothetical protein [Bryobacterales bacterium]